MEVSHETNVSLDYPGFDPCQFAFRLWPKASSTTKISPVTLEPIEGTDFQRVILTEKAAQRLDIKTAEVSGISIPYAAVIYDTEGNTFVYTNPAPLTFVRAPIMIDRIEGDQAVFSRPFTLGLRL